jgi:hypothetical protein
MMYYRATVSVLPLLTYLARVPIDSIKHSLGRPYKPLCNLLSSVCLSDIISLTLLPDNSTPATLVFLLFFKMTGASFHLKVFVLAVPLTFNVLSADIYMADFL